MVYVTGMQPLTLAATQGEFYGREVILADRDCVETGADVIFEHAKDDDVSFLVVGDPLWCVLAALALILTLTHTRSVLPAAPRPTRT